MRIRPFSPPFHCVTGLGGRRVRRVQLCLDAHHRTEQSGRMEPTFTASTMGATTYTLTVTDSLGTTASDSVTITVTAQSGGSDGDGGDDGSRSTLVANAGADRTTSVGASVALDGSACPVEPLVYLRLEPEQRVVQRHGRSAGVYAGAWAASPSRSPSRTPPTLRPPTRWW